MSRPSVTETILPMATRSETSAVRRRRRPANRALRSPAECRCLANWGNTAASETSRDRIRAASESARHSAARRADCAIAPGPIGQHRHAHRRQTDGKTADQKDDAAPPALRRDTGPPIDVPKSAAATASGGQLQTEESALSVMPEIRIF